MGLQALEEGQNNWITHFKLIEYSRSDLYLQTVYYMVITMTTIGYGDFFPITPGEKVFITIVALIATNVCAYSFSQISEIVKYEQDKKYAYQQMMQGINKEMNDIGLNILLQHKVRKYYEFQHNQQNEDRQNKLTLIENLPAQIKEEVLLDVNVEFLKQVAFINQLSSECKKLLSLKIKQRIFYPDEIVFKEKEDNTSLFYISQGSIVLTIPIKTKNQLSQENQSEMNIEYLKKKDVFGFEGFMYNHQNPYNAKSIGYTVLSYIDREEINSLIQNFPKDYEKFSFIRDQVVLSGKYNLIKKKCISCGEQIHCFRDCPKINPIFKMKEIFNYKEKQINPDRKQMVRKRVSLTKAIKDQHNIAYKAAKVMSRYDEESMLSELCSVLVEEDGQDNSDEEDDQQEDDVSIQYQDEEKDLEGETQDTQQNIFKKKLKKKPTYHESESSDILDEEELYQMERKKEKRLTGSVRTRNVSLNDMQNLLSQLNQESIQKQQSANLALRNEIQRQAFQNGNYSKFKGNITVNGIQQEKPKNINNQLDIIDENEEETVNMVGSEMKWPSPMKKRHETEIINESATPKQVKLLTINELNNEQLDNSELQSSKNAESPKNNSVSFESNNVSIQMKQISDSHANQVNVFSSPLTSPIHTIQQIKQELQKKQSQFNFQSQNSNNFVSQSTLKALEADLNINNNSNVVTNINNINLQLVNTSSFNQQNTNPLNSSSSNNNNNQANNNNHFAFNINSNDFTISPQTTSDINQNNQINVSQEGNQGSNQSTKPTSMNRRASCFENEDDQDEQEDNASNLENIQQDIHQLVPVINLRNNMTSNSENINGSYFDEQLLNVQENNDDSYNFSKNRNNFQEYDIYNKVLTKRAQKAQKTYIHHERTIAKKLTQKVAQNSTLEDILNHIQRTNSRRMTPRKTFLQLQQQQQLQSSQALPSSILKNSQKNQEEGSFTPKILNQNLSSIVVPLPSSDKIQLQVEKNPLVAPLLAVTMSRKNSKKQTRANIPHYPSYLDPHSIENNQNNTLKHRRLGTVKITNMGSQKEIDGIQSPRRNGKVGTRIQTTGKTILQNQPKNMERKPTHGTNSSMLGNNQMNQLNTSNLIEQPQSTQNANGMPMEDNAEFYEYLIKCQYNLQDLDLLIVRKNILLEQQKGLMPNTLFVEDNEIDIDLLKDYKQYYPKQNHKEIIKIIRKNQNKILKLLYPNVKLNQPKNSSKQSKKQGKNGDLKNPKQNSKSSFNPMNQHSLLSINNA